MVRLKAILALKVKGRYYDFNSNMVRLKVRPNQTANWQFLFQFQYGAIKRKRLSDSPQRLIQFQFQYGAIKRDAQGFGLKNLLPFQFQYGAIKR